MKKESKESKQMILVRYIIRDGNSEHHEFSWWRIPVEKDYGKTIDDKFLIHEVYGDDEEEVFEDHYDINFVGEDRYEDSDGRLIHVGSVQNITKKDLAVLIKFGVVPK